MPECSQGLECRDQGAESIHGYGKCDDSEKLGGFGDQCDGWDEDRNRIPGCADEFECGALYWHTLLFGKRCMNRRKHVGLQEQCGFDEFSGMTFPECKSGLVCHSTGDRYWYERNICLKETVGLGKTCEEWNDSLGEPFPRCADSLVCKLDHADFKYGEANSC